MCSPEPLWNETYKVGIVHEMEDLDIFLWHEFQHQKARDLVLQTARGQLSAASVAARTYCLSFRQQPQALAYSSALPGQCRGRGRGVGGPEVPFGQQAQGTGAGALAVHTPGAGTALQQRQAFSTQFI